MMALVEKNIAFVREQTQDDMTYCWFVVMKSGRVSDSRRFINLENDRTVCKAYPVERLPKAVQSFIRKHDRKDTTGKWEQEHMKGYRLYTYEA